MYIKAGIIGIVFDVLSLGTHQTSHSSRCFDHDFSGETETSPILFFEMGHSYHRPFKLSSFLDSEYIFFKMPVPVLEPEVYGVGSNHSANCATTPVITLFELFTENRCPDLNCAPPSSEATFLPTMPQPNSYTGPWWCWSGQRARLLLWQFQLESHWILQFLMCKNGLKRTKIN